ncbi:Myosin-6 [Hondaea fermentalgiana]|uniref:Myosin-6 n=1 Tax=Hondaea fermentalgiana TaxID=2315210 RepID=A0A2R5GQ02_9STRA|nr:Myosin-6 [Hondaea fermentalgiana]|eukprot:GBG32956.1 Myosin-6 [Hondaea fermentalgiana]
MGRAEKDLYDEGAAVWVRDPDEAWARGVITEKLRDGSVVVKTDKRTTVTAPLDDVEFCSTSPRQEVKVDDLTQLPDLHQAALLSTLHVRFEADKIYTFSGEILIAVNPFKRIRGLYEPSSMAKYVNAGVGEVELLDPHAYRIAGAAYKAMTTYSGRNQSILVSGESGAGKTYNTKVLLSYLTVVSAGDTSRGINEFRASLKRGSRRTNVVGSSVSQRVLEANPLMEAFGNAKTLRNDNSSRFGKLIELDFDRQSARLMGAAIDVYLLEKARVVHQQEGERNYHIFYEMNAGLSREERNELSFPDLRSCRYIESSTMDRADIDDKSQWKLTNAAFDIIGFTDTERLQVLRVMSAVLHLGNISFEPHNVNGAEGSKVSRGSKDSAELCASLLGVDKDQLVAALTTRGISVGGGGFLAALSGPTESLVKQHTVTQAEEAREALAMALYERTFGWIVWRINESIGVSNKMAQKSRAARKSRAAIPISRAMMARALTTGKSAEPEYYDDHSIGVLDIFGFEVFESNGFEQLMINYTNERLQGQFNEHIFKLEAALFEAEGLDWSVIDWPDNQLTLDMIETRPIGLLSLLDETCLMGSGTDKSFVSKIYQNLTKGKFSTVIRADRNQQVRLQFEIAHFAGPVAYNSESFITKNKNELRVEAVDLLRSSDDKWLSILMPPDASAAGGGSDAQEYFSHLANQPRNQRSSLQRHRRVSPTTTRLQQKTVSSHFRTQLSVALNHINASQPHYIRCIKPNDLNVETVFDRVRVEEQLAYSGVLEVVRVARAGYPTRFALRDFADRFHVLSVSRSSKRRHSKRRSKGHKSDFRSTCEHIVKSAKLEIITDYQIGHTKVFLKPYAYTTLELLKAERVLKYVLILQRSVRVWLRTYRATKKLRAAKKIQRNVRGFLVRRKVGGFRRERRAAIAIQRIARGVLARAHVVPLIEQRIADDKKRRESAARRIKKAYRRKVLKDRLREIHEESVRQRSAVMLQSLARVIKAQKLANSMYAERVADDAARTLQGVARILAAKKTKEMLEQERIEEEEEEPNLFILYAGPLLVLFLFTQPLLMIGLAGVAVAMLAGAGMALEAEQRQTLFQQEGASYSRRARRHRRRYGDPDGFYDDDEGDDLSDEDDDFDDDAASDVSDDVGFFKRNKGNSRKLTRQLSRLTPGKEKTSRSQKSSRSRKPSRSPSSASRRPSRAAEPSPSARASRKLAPARKGISSRKLEMTAYDDFDVYFSGSKKKPSRNRIRRSGGAL